MENDLILYTLQEVATMLRLSRATIYNYVKQGKLKAVKIGLSWKIKEADLKEFINQKTNV